MRVASRLYTALLASPEGIRFLESDRRGALLQSVAAEIVRLACEGTAESLARSPRRGTAFKVFTRSPQRAPLEASSEGTPDGQEGYSKSSPVKISLRLGYLSLTRHTARVLDFARHARERLPEEERSHEDSIPHGTSTLSFTALSTGLAREFVGLLGCALFKSQRPLYIPQSARYLCGWVRYSS